MRRIRHSPDEPAVGANGLLIAACSCAGGSGTALALGAIVRQSREAEMLKVEPSMRPARPS